MDIRLVRGRSHRLWAWIATLVGVMALAYLAGVFLGDPTDGRGRASGANANFGADRGAVVPIRAGPFESAFPLQDRELGRLLRVRGWAESQMRGGSLWVRTTAGRWILMRFEPSAPSGSNYYPGAPVDVVGYLEKISLAEFNAWLDTLGVYLPRPRPGVKFGDLPDSGFTRVDTLFIRSYYISVRPEGTTREAVQAATVAPAVVPRRDSVPAGVPPAAPAASPPPAVAPQEPVVTRPPPARTPRRTPVRPSEPRDVRPSIPEESPEVRRPNAPRDTLRLPR